MRGWVITPHCFMWIPYTHAGLESRCQKERKNTNTLYVEVGKPAQIRNHLDQFDLYIQPITMTLPQ